MVSSSHFFEDRLGKTTVLLLENVELTKDGLLRGFPKKLVIVIEIEALLLFSLIL